jgi:predicted ATPase/transcriptional regulator with XRE-family HTH domain
MVAPALYKAGFGFARDLRRDMEEIVQNNMSMFGQWLKQQRKLRDLTQEELADQAGCAFETIRKIEGGTRRASRQMAEALARALGVPALDVDKIADLARLGSDLLPGDEMPLPYRRQVGNLPAQRTSFVGREDDLNGVCDLLLHGNVRLLTLVGPPGIGKTRLGLRVAEKLRERFAHGAFFIPLSSITDPGVVASTVAANLGVRVVLPGTPTDALSHFLESREVLLLLDNFEHLLPASRLLGELVTHCPGLTVLVTSRTALRIYGEHQFPVPPLLMPDQTIASATELAQFPAVSLFYQRARAVSPAFALTNDNTATVAEICRQLDGLPLAIELAAARSKALTPAAILARLGNKAKLLTTGGHDLPRRQQTLWGAIDWSYDLLSNVERVLFRRLSVFAGGCALEAIEKVCHLPGDAESDLFEALTSLLDKSLAQRDKGDGGESRYSMLWTLREYAQQRLAESGEEDAVRRQHALAMLSLAEEAEPHLADPARNPWLTKLDADLDNLRAALAWSLSERGDVHVGLRLAGALHWYWYFRAYITEGRKWLGEVLSKADRSQHTRALAKALYAAGRLAEYYYEGAIAIPFLEESVSIWRELEDKRALAYALVSAGIIGTQQLDSTRFPLVDEAVSLFRQVGDKWGLAYALDMAGDVAWWQGDVDAAANFKRESLSLYRELDDKWYIGYQMGQNGYIAILQGDYSTARACFDEAMIVDSEVGDRWSMASLLRGLGNVAHLDGDYSKAAILYEESMALYRELGDRARLAAVTRCLGHIEHLQGNYEQARAFYREALAIHQELKRNWAVCLDIAGIAGIAGAIGQVELGALLLAVIPPEKANLKTMSRVDFVHYEQNIAHARAQLGTEAFEALFAEGHKMDLRQFITASNTVGSLPDPANVIQDRYAITPGGGALRK